MSLTVPELSLVLLVGPSGCGKSTFAAQHFLPTEVVSSDRCRALVSDVETDQTATTDAFAVLHFIAGKRLARGKLTVVDATNVQERARKPLIELARSHHVMPVAIVFDLPESVCQERNRLRADRDIGPHVIRNQRSEMRRSLYRLRSEGFREVHILRSPEEVASVAVEREPLRPNRRHERGPFDLIGDIHGCGDELEELLTLLGYVPGVIGADVVADPYAASPTVETPRGASPPEAPEGTEGSLGIDGAAAGDAPRGVSTVGGGTLRAWRHPAGRRAVFLGDLVDRGPRVPDVLRIVMDMVAAGTAFCVPGNHDDKLKRALQGKKTQLRHGLEQSMAQLAEETPEFRARVERFLDGLVSHFVLDGGRLVAAHAGMREEMQGRSGGAVRAFALYGETTGEMDEFGLPVRANWAAEYRGSALVVYGHTPVHVPEWLNRTINVDTGCVFGGRLTALRYPEKELVSVPAKQAYAASRRPFPEPAALSAQQQVDEVLDLEDVLGQRTLSTRLRPSILIREENAVAALEVMSRFAANPKWLIYLPPTMSPSETADPATHPGLLEHPAQAFAHYRERRVDRVVCEEKHMGSRAVVVVCRDEDAARRRFGVQGEGIGVCFTRTGRPFFTDNLSGSGAGQETERELLALLRGALDRSGFWDKLGTDWVCLDTELMPWSAKAQELIRQQYAAVSAAARGALPEAVANLEAAARRGVAGTEELLARFRERGDLAERYTAAWRRYCWPVTSVADLRLAPFHLLATEGAVHTDKDHLWHLEALSEICRAAPDLLIATRHQVVDLADPASEAEATRWWEEMTEAGGEGMVIKPLPFLPQGERGLIQPALKCRGREYLRIIYGPEHTLPENLERLRARGLSAKRSLALREFALGIEALERFTRREPLRRVHECVFGVLALESEPVDPRL